jgi:hypothetical protein
VSKRTWHEGAASIIILPGGEDGEQLLNIVQEWTQCWMLKPAFWVRSDDVSSREQEQSRVDATIIARNGRKVIDLLDYLSGVDLSQVRLLAVRTVNSSSEHDQAQDEMIDVIYDVLNRSRPYNVVSDTEAKNQTHLMRINLVFAPSKRKGASFNHLIESSWDINLVVAPEDRSTPSRFDKSTRDSNDADKDKWHRFLISNTAVAAGIWAGQEKSIFEAASQFSDLSPVFGQVRVMRTFVRGILSEGLSTRVAADALRRSGNAETSKIDQLLPFPNRFLEAYEGERVSEVIDQMVEQTIGFSGSRLKYDEVELIPPPSQEETGVVAGLKYFFKTTWSLFKVLPLWFFAAIWNQIAIFFSRLIFGNKGRKRIVGTIDFPRTNLDKNAEAELVMIKERRDKIQSLLEKWPTNVVRKSEPILWSEMRKLMIGRLDASPLPHGVEQEKGTNGKLVIGDLNSVLPDINERWELPADIERTISSQTRSTNWQQVENIEDLTNFFANTVLISENNMTALNAKSEKIELDKVAKEAELDGVINQLEELRRNSLLSSVVPASSEEASK